MAAVQRIVSLLPGSTEILCALGAETRLVGISQRCDYPATVTRLPRVTRPAPAAAAEGAADPDPSVLALAGLSPEPLDLDVLRQLQPDLLITQASGATDTAAPASVLEATRRLLGPHVEVLSLQPTLLQDIWDAIHLLGAATGQQRQAATLLEALFARVHTLLAESLMLHQPPRVAVLGHCAPLQLAGHWLPDMIQIAGGSVGLSSAGAPGPRISWEQLRDYAPEVLLVMPYDAGLEQARACLAALQALPGWETLPAVQQGQAYAVDGRTLLYRPGPRIVDGLELLAGLMHPDLFGETLEAHQQVYEALPA